VSMASAVVVRNMKLQPFANFISIDLKFGEGDNVREVTSPAQFVSDPKSGLDATWGQQIREARWLSG